ncbi:hypothetical protein BLNAU_17514 [Blattamonas nauphoetae]|uniref:Uncharacterized protein n=1 Tax=Blattamonas nauphoetae TaxID=2049346 RepID=A0ABQ9X7B5_9EUKA|nr:hypothetical protein BLNAU_17514 [Blattamonas nauphoetae]
MADSSVDSLEHSPSTELSDSDSWSLPSLDFYSPSPTSFPLLIDSASPPIHQIDHQFHITSPHLLHFPVFPNPPSHLSSPPTSPAPHAHQSRPIVSPSPYPLFVNRPFHQPTEQHILRKPEHCSLIRMWMSNQEELDITGDHVSFQPGHESITVEVRLRIGSDPHSPIGRSPLFRIKIRKEMIVDVQMRGVHLSDPPSFNLLSRLDTNQPERNDTPLPPDPVITNSPHTDIVIQTNTRPILHKLLEQPKRNKSIDEGNVLTIGNTESGAFGLQFVFRVAKHVTEARRLLKEWNAACDRKEAARRKRKH